VVAVISEIAVSGTIDDYQVLSILGEYYTYKKDSKLKDLLV
jgi:hypothetical protein